jgi:hypothetical protein
MKAEWSERESDRVRVRASRVTPQQKGSDQEQSDPSPRQRGGPISKHVKVGKEQKYEYIHGSRRGPKPRTTVLARTSSS